MKRLATGEGTQKHTRIEEPVHKDTDKVVGEVRIKRRPKFTLMEPNKKQSSGTKKKDTRQNSGMQVVGKSVERCDFLKSFAYAPARITFGQMENGDVDDGKKQLQKMIAKKVLRSSVNVSKEADRRPATQNRHQVVELAVYSEALYSL